MRTIQTRAGARRSYIRTRSALPSRGQGRVERANRVSLALAREGKVADEAALGPRGPLTDLFRGDGASTLLRQDGKLLVMVNRSRQA